jgi:hypothetical protein
MSKRNSDWYIPPEWLWALTLPGVGLMASIFLPLLSVLKTADVRALYRLGLGAGLLGAFLLLTARMPLYRERRFWTIGPKQLDRTYRRIYWLAYIFVAVSLLQLGVVWLRAHGEF